MGGTGHGDSATWRERSDAAGEGLSAEERDYISVTEKRYAGVVQKHVKTVQNIMLLVRDWPPFFQTRESCGEKVHEALQTAACQSLILGALFASVSITPLFSALPQNVADWKARAHGALWAMLLMCNIATIGTSALLLFHLLGCPPPLGWVWMCNVGPFLISTPFVLMSVSAPLSFVAISCSVWFIYGRVVGTLTFVVSALLVLYGTYFTLVIGARHVATLTTGGVAAHENQNGTIEVNDDPSSLPSHVSEQAPP